MLNNRNLININKTRMHKRRRDADPCFMCDGTDRGCDKLGKELSVNHRDGTAKRSLIETIFRV